MWIKHRVDKEQTYCCAIVLESDWVLFEDGIVLFNPFTSSTVLYHPILKKFKSVFTNSYFTANQCLDAVDENEQTLALETLASLEELGFIYRKLH